MLLRLAVVVAVAACTLAAHAAHEDAKPDCLKSGDGYYVKGCSAKFWRCVNDRLYTYDCPKGLYFNPIKRKCEYKTDVPICSQGVKVDSKNVIKASAEFNCTGLEDGPYKPRDIACSNTFITCFTGYAAEQACPFGQFFHEENRACDYKDNVPGCLKTEKKRSIGAERVDCPALRSGHVDIPCNADEVCQKIEKPVDGKYLCPTPFAVWYGPLGLASADQWTLAPEGLRCGDDGRWYNGNMVVTAPAVDCTAKRSAMAQPTYGAAAPALPQPAAQTSLNAKAASLNACPGLLTGKDSEGIPCDADEVCQAIRRPKNGRYTCEAPFSVYYGPVRGASAQWNMAKEGLVCGADGFWYDAGVKVDASGIDCTAKKTDFQKNDDETQGCPSLSTNEREIPCKGDHEVCQPILKAVAGKYACPTPYRVWYGPKGSDASLWKQAKDALICKSGSWFDGDVKIDASAVDCTVQKIDCSKLGDGTYNGEPGRCSTHFWQCSNEQAYLYPCPPGLFFDDFSKTCDFKEVVESCGGVRRSPAAATTTTTAAPAADVAVIRKTDCSAVLTDSTLACKEGEACVAPADPVNQKYLCETPYTLSFGPKNNLHQWRQAPNGIQCKDGHWFNGEEQIAPEAVHCTTQKFACSGKKDGSYSAHPEKCTAYFWNCAHDDAFLYTCPAGLFFDVDTLSCDYKEVIAACGGVKKDKAPKEVSIPSSDSPSSSSSAFDCAGKDNGYHETAKCQKTFWNCADGKSFQIDCPEGLVYDGRVQLCQYPLACSSDLPATTTPATPPATLDHGDISQKPALPTTSFDCSSKPDGIYAEKKCHKQYVECANGRTFAKECPAGLVYTPFNKACDYKQTCMNPPTTVAPATTPAAAPAETTAYSSYANYDRIPATTKAPVAPPASDLPNCAHLEDGAHALARCGVEFFMCWNGETSVSKCNDGLIFNPANSQCDYRSNVIECGPAADATTAAPGQAAPPSPPTASPVTPDLFCEGRKDGHFGSGCQSFFYSCQNGATTKMFCPVGLHYDAESKTCDMRESIIACGGKKEGPTTPAAAPASSSYLQPTPVAPVQDVPIIDAFCVGKDDGFHSHGCQSFFYSCQNGKTHKMMCPPNLFYDAARKTCDRKEDIVACGAAPTQAFTTPAAAPASNYQTYQRPTVAPVAPVQPVAPVKDIPVVNVENFCMGKEDGFFANGCQDFFYSCQNGQTHKMACPAGLFYDAIKNACDVREEIVACGAAPAATQAPVTTPAAAPASTYHQLPLVKDTPVVAAVENFCIGKEAGFYSANSCESFYYYCQNGIAHKMHCATGLIYDADKKTCEHKEDIVGCGATATQAPTTPAAAAPASSYQTIQPVPVKVPVFTSIEKFCVGKDDGFHSHGCQSFFYSCQNGKTHKMACPMGLFYDADHKKCDNKEEIVACGGAAPTQAPVTKPADIPAVVVENFCNGKTDGFYALGCASFFYSCQSESTYKMTCPSGLFYDVVKKQCLNREEILACGLVPTQTTQTAAPTTTTPAAAPAQTTQAPAPYAAKPHVPIVVTANFCAGKVDAVYGVGCQNFFYSCQSGVSYKTTCSSDLFFDVDTKQCNYKEFIVACGGKKEEIAPATAAPVTAALDNPTALDTFCLAKEDGFYGPIGCATFFYSCQGSATYKMLCPADLYYDVANKACDRKEEIAACRVAQSSTPSIALAPSAPAYGTPAVPIAPSRDQQPIPLITPENFCGGKADGFYGNGCVSHFFSCENGNTHKMACPSGLFYDAAKKSCEHREEIAECGGQPAPVAPAAVAPVAPVAPSPYAQPALPAQPTAAPARDNANFCAGKSDGIYLRGCASHYTQCSNEITHKMACPSGLFYDVHSKFCDIKENVAACGDKRTVVAAPATPVAPAPYVQPAQPAQPMATIAPVRDNVNFCTGKTDGIYMNGCESTYIQCANELTYKMACPSGLFYDVTSKFCDIKENVAACGGKRTVAAAPVAPAPYAQPAQPAQPMATVAPIRDALNFCAGKTDGIYLNGCESTYIQCANELTYKMACPSGLFYDVTAKFCDIKENVAACGDKRTVVAAPATPVAPAPYVQPAQPAQPMATIAPVRDNVNFCTGKTDGIYMNGCESTYIQCANELTYKMACPSGLFYDVTSKFCDIKENVAACGGKRTVAAAPVAPAPYAQPAQPAQPMATVAPIRDALNFCAGKTDGIYLNGCESTYIQCANELTYKMACPSGLFYDVTAKFCDIKENVAACGGKRTVAAAPVVPAPAPYAQPAQPIATVAPIRDAVNFCTGKTDGIYMNGCESTYTQCANGLTYKMACPSGLFYDVTAKFCDIKENVAACGGKRTVVAAPATPVAPAPYVQPAQPMATVAPARDAVNFCTGKVDGIYMNGCESTYTQCANGLTYKMACPSGLFYDVTAKFCDIKENVAACGGKRTVVAAPASPVAPAPYAQPVLPAQPAQPTAAPVSDVIAVAPIENFCAGKVDGIYLNGCESFYTSCSNGVTYKMACPSGLFFDVSSKMCDVKEHVAACGGKKTVAAPYVQPAATAAPPRDIQNFCSGKTDGIYATGCVSDYTSCSAGVARTMACPSSLFYDAHSDLCDVKEKVVACGGVKTVIPVAPFVQPVQPAQPTSAPVRDVIPVVPSENFCAGKVDGIYLNGCESYYTSCVAGTTYKMACPSGLFYDVTSKFCDIKENVAACGGKGTVAPVVPLARDQPAPPVDNYCAGKADGWYAEGCQTHYYSCLAGTTYKMFCPSSLFYDSAKKACFRREEITACGAVAAAPAAPVTPAAAVPQYTSPAAPAPPPARPSSPAAPVAADNFCAGKVDGVHTAGCATFYYSCQNGYTAKMACPSGLFFDEAANKCEVRENVPACGGQQPQQQQPQTQYQPAPTTTAPVRDTVVVPGSSFCSGKADGYNGEGCQNFFFYCSNGAAQKMECAPGLFFDSTSKKCEYRENVVACGGTQPTPAAASAAPAYSPPTTTATPAAAPASYSKPTAAPAKDKPVIKSVNDRSCIGQKNGFFGEGCNDFFYSCIEGVSYKMACPTGLFYDLELQSCEYKDNVPNCGGRRPEVTATPSPALDNLSPAPVSNTQCSGKTDGIYPAADCASEFIACQAGLVRKEACQAGLFYNEANKMCDYRENVAKCSARDSLPTRAPAAEYGRTTSRPITRPTVPKPDAHKEEQLKTKPALSPADFPLITIKVRRHRFPRQSMFSTSESREDLDTDEPAPILPRSPASKHHKKHRLDAQRAMALILVAAPVCQALTALSMTTFSKPLCTLEQIFASRNHGLHHQRRAAAINRSRRVGTSCAASADGYFSNGCSSDYVACINGNSMNMHCPSDLMYSASTQMCDYSDNVPECGGSVPLLKDAPVVAPRPLVQPTPSPVMPISPQKTRPTQAPVKEVHPRCAGRTDGIYALAPCSQHYIACVDEKATIGICREDLFYSTVTGLCDWKEKIPACTILVRPTPLIPRAVPTVTPLPATAAPVADPVRPTGERLIRPTVPLGVTPDCSLIADGVYAVNTCSPYYTRCANGRLTARGTCPKGLVFSSATSSCVARSALSTCSAPVTTPAPVAPVATQAPALAPVQPNYGVQQAQQQPMYQQQQPVYQQQQQQYGNQQMQQQPTYSQQYAPSYNTYSPNYASGVYADPSQFCYGKSNGIYGNTCQRSYVTCKGGATFAFQCPGEFVFSRERAVCDHPGRMAECGGPTYGYAPAASYQQQQQSYSPY